MAWGVRWYLVGSVILGVLGVLAGCSGGFIFAEREPWRHEAEVQCLTSGAVKESANVVRIQAIHGPGMCGADFPLKVSALGEGGSLGYSDELRPPGAIPGVRRNRAGRAMRRAVMSPRPTSRSRCLTRRGRRRRRGSCPPRRATDPVRRTDRYRSAPRPGRPARAAPSLTITASPTAPRRRRPRHRRAPSQRPREASRRAAGHVAGAVRAAAGRSMPRAPSRTPAVARSSVRVEPLPQTEPVRAPVRQPPPVLADARARRRCRRSVPRAGRRSPDSIGTGRGEPGRDARLSDGVGARPLDRQFGAAGGDALVRRLRSSRSSRFPPIPAAA